MTANISDLAEILKNGKVRNLE